MFGKTALALAIVGFISTASAAIRPMIPRWVSADKYGSAYALVNYWNGTYSYEGSSSFSWDFDYNCARSYFYSYSTYEWEEAAYCNNQVNYYSSKTGCASQNVGYFSLESQTKEWADQFTISYGAGFADPVWNSGSYHILEHQSDYVYLYLDPSTGAIQYIVESFPAYSADVVAYFPNGLQADNSTYGVWDYELRYAYCPSASAAFNLNSKVFSHAKAALAKPALEKPSNLSAKPETTPVEAAQNLAKLGGIRALFSGKVASEETKAAPNKATFLLNKEHSAEKSPINMFMNLKNAAVSAPTQGKVQQLFKNAKPNSLKDDEKFQKVKSFINNFQGESLHSDAELTQEVDMFFLMVDSNKDNFVTFGEFKTAVQAQGQEITDEQLQFVFYLIDSNHDGKISYAELFNFAKSQGQQGGFSLYTRSEKVNLVFAYYDANTSGYLEQAEIKRLLVDSYGYATDADAVWFISLVDTNFDGKISWQELYNVME